MRRNKSKPLTQAEVKLKRAGIAQYVTEQVNTLVGPLLVEKRLATHLQQAVKTNIADSILKQLKVSEGGCDNLEPRVIDKHIIEALSAAAHTQQILSALKTTYQEYWKALDAKVRAIIVVNEPVREAIKTALDDKKVKEEAPVRDEAEEEEEEAAALPGAEEAVALPGAEEAVALPDVPAQITKYCVALHEISDPQFFQKRVLAAYALLQRSYDTAVVALCTAINDDLLHDVTLEVKQYGDIVASLHPDLQHAREIMNSTTADPLTKMQVCQTAQDRLSKLMGVENGSEIRIRILEERYQQKRQELLDFCLEGNLSQDAQDVIRTHITQLAGVIPAYRTIGYYTAALSALAAYREQREHIKQKAHATCRDELVQRLGCVQQKCWQDGKQQDRVFSSAQAAINAAITALPETQHIVSARSALDAEIQAVLAPDFLPTCAAYKEKINQTILKTLLDREIEHAKPPRKTHFENHKKVLETHQQALEKLKSVVADKNNTFDQMPDEKQSEITAFLKKAEQCHQQQIIALHILLTALTAHDAELKKAQDTLERTRVLSKSTAQTVITETTRLTALLATRATPNPTEDEKAAQKAAQEAVQAAKTAAETAVQQTQEAEAAVQQALHNTETAHQQFIKPIHDEAVALAQHAETIAQRGKDPALLTITTPSNPFDIDETLTLTERGAHWKAAATALCHDAHADDADQDKYKNFTYRNATITADPERICTEFKVSPDNIQVKGRVATCKVSVTFERPPTALDPAAPPAPIHHKVTKDFTVHRELVTDSRGEKTLKGTVSGGDFSTNARVWVEAELALDREMCPDVVKRVYPLKSLDETVRNPIKRDKTFGNVWLTEKETVFIKACWDAGYDSVVYEHTVFKNPASDVLQVAKGMAEPQEKAEQPRLMPFHPFIRSPSGALLFMETVDTLFQRESNKPATFQVKMYDGNLIPVTGISPQVLYRALFTDETYDAGKLQQYLASLFEDSATAWDDRRNAFARTIQQLSETHPYIATSGSSIPTTSSTCAEVAQLFLANPMQRVSFQFKFTSKPDTFWASREIKTLDIREVTLQEFQSAFINRLKALDTPHFASPIFSAEEKTQLAGLSAGVFLRTVLRLLADNDPKDSAKRKMLERCLDTVMRMFNERSHPFLYKIARVDGAKTLTMTEAKDMFSEANKEKVISFEIKPCCGGGEPITVKGVTPRLLLNALRESADDVPYDEGHLLCTLHEIATGSTCNGIKIDESELATKRKVLQVAVTRAVNETAITTPVTVSFPAPR